MLPNVAEKKGSRDSRFGIVSCLDLPATDDAEHVVAEARGPRGREGRFPPAAQRDEAGGELGSAARPFEHLAVGPNFDNSLKNIRHLSQKLKR